MIAPDEVTKFLSPKSGIEVPKDQIISPIISFLTLYSYSKHKNPEVSNHYKSTTSSLFVQ